MKKKSYPLSEVYRLIETGPTIMVSTSKGGKDNVMSMSWHTMMEFTPPLIGIILSELNYSFKLLQATKECVINIPTEKLADIVVKVGNISGEKIDKFEKFKLTKLPAAKVKAPLVGECYANLECKVVDTALVKKYNFFVLQVVKAWIDTDIKNPKTIHHLGDGRFIVDGKTVKYPWEWRK